MANTVSPASNLPGVPDFVLRGGRAAAVFHARAQSEQAVAMGRAFAELAGFFRHALGRMGNAIAEAHAMRDLVNLNDRTLEDIGIRRSDIPAIIARGGFENGYDVPVERFRGTREEINRAV